MSLLHFLLILFALFLLAVYGSYRAGTYMEFSGRRAYLWPMLAGIFMMQIVDMIFGGWRLIGMSIGAAVGYFAFWLGNRKKKRLDPLGGLEVEEVFGDAAPAPAAMPKPAPLPPTKYDDMDGVVYVPIEGYKR